MCNPIGVGALIVVAVTFAALAAPPTSLAGAPSGGIGPAGSMDVPPAGDAGCSEVVDSIDASLILQFVAGLLKSVRCGPFADVDGDAALTAIDAALILEFAAGLLDGLPVQLEDGMTRPRR